VTARPPFPAAPPRPPLPGSLAADPWRSVPARIVAIRDEVPGVRGYDLEIRDPDLRAAFRFGPGQFNMLLLPGIGEAAISIASDPARPDRLTHTVRAVGNVTSALERLAVGDEVLVRGPLGNPWPLDELAGGEVVVVAGGLGLASQRALILALCRRRPDFRRVTVVVGAKTPAAILYRAEHDAWRAAGIEVEAVVDAPDDAWRGRVGMVTEVLAAVHPAADAHVLCCGPDAMMTATARVAMGLGLAASRVWLSMERPMSCAVGQCGLCQFGPFFVCLDGPVFRYDRVAALLEVPQL